MNLASFPSEHSLVFSDMEQNFEKSNKNENLLEDLYETCSQDEVLKEMFEDVIDVSQRYVEDICVMIEVESQEESRERQVARQQIDASRNLLHESVISTINPLYRYLASQNKNVSSLSPYVGNNRDAYKVLAIRLTYERIIKTLKQKNERAN